MFVLQIGCSQNSTDAQARTVTLPAFAANRRDFGSSIVVMYFHTTTPLRRRASSARAALTRLGAGASLLSLLALAACSGADKGPVEPVTPPVVPPTGTDPGIRATGIAAVASAGLPSGVSSRLTLKNGSVERLLVGTSSVAGLTAGEWIATAEPVTADGVTYLPTPVTQTVTVAPGGSVSISVTYVANTGALDITISGLPTGGNGDVILTGPNNYRRTFGVSLAITALAPGQYHFEARGVKLAAGSFAPSARSRMSTSWPAIRRQQWRFRMYLRHR